MWDRKKIVKYEKHELGMGRIGRKKVLTDEEIEERRIAAQKHVRYGKKRKMYVIDVDLDAQFKKACEDTGVTMSETLEKFMLMYVNKVMSSKIG